MEKVSAIHSAWAEPWRSKCPQVGTVMGKRSHKDSQSSGAGNSLMFLQHLLDWAGVGNKPSSCQVPRFLCTSII